MRRREFISLLGGAAAAWPMAAPAQQDGRLRRIGWLLVGAESDLGWQANVAALREVLAKLGWIEGRNLRTDLRYAADDPDRVRAYAAELVGLAPDVIVTSGGQRQAQCTADGHHSDRIHCGRRRRGRRVGA